MKLTIYTLEGCSQCDKFKIGLKQSNIPFADVVCEKQNTKCDELENITNCDLYPMCIVDSNGKKIIVCLTHDIEKLSNIKSINSSCAVVYTHSIDNMIHLIKNV
jgi:glutaredoxin